jgi:3-hydroxyacyl-CoA dehydrogenase, NAD binding domain
VLPLRPEGCGFCFHRSLHRRPRRCCCGRQLFEPRRLPTSAAFFSQGAGGGGGSDRRRGMATTTTTTTAAASTSSSNFDTVGCVGLGLMGHGICQVAAASHVHSKVIAYEKEQKYLDAGKDRILKSLDRLVEGGKLTLEFADNTMGRIDFTTDVEALGEVDFVVEAIIENMDLKEDLYTKLGKLCKPETIFASNTSSLSIAEMASFSGRPDRFIGIHFFNPVQVRFCCCCYLSVCSKLR